MRMMEGLKYHESLIPRVHAVLQDRVNKTNKPVLAFLDIVTDLQLVLQQSLQLLWRVVLDQGSTGCTALDCETMAGVLGLCITVCSSNEWNDELLHSIEELRKLALIEVCMTMLGMDEVDSERSATYVLDLF